MISAKVDNSQVIAKFTKLPQSVMSALVPTIDKIGTDLVTHVVRDKLSGQVLNRRSGTLSNAITHTPPEINGNSIGTMVGVFSGVPYARLHEYGGTITREVFWGRPRKGGSREVTYPERSYLRTGLADQRESILAQISNGVQGAL